jgi:hypothetical protein
VASTRLIATLPMALGGESTTGNSTAIAVISAVSLVLGYLLIAALWHFVFRDPSRGKRKRKRDGPD